MTETGATTTPRQLANRLVTAVGRNLPAASVAERSIATLFHRMYYGKPERTWQNTRWLGTKIMKVPTDLWIYQELIHSGRPDLIVETGTFSGASAHYLGTLCDIVGNGRVITIDIEHYGEPPEHPRVTHLLGSSISDEITARVREEAGAAETVMVILDSDHTRDHVLAELDTYAPLVTAGSYLIVEDTNVNGHPARPRFGPGPMEAIDDWLPRHPEFEVDPECEKFFMTFNPRGYLRRI